MKIRILKMQVLIVSLIMFLAVGSVADPAQGVTLIPAIPKSVYTTVKEPLEGPNWEWKTDTIDPIKQFDLLTDHSLAQDSAGNAHIAYGQDHLYYAAYDRGMWRWHIADWSQGVGQYAAISLDDNQLPHISYYDETHGDLRYAHFSGSDWITMTVDSAGAVGQFTSIALDASGYPHISYYDATNSGLKYASFDGSTWTGQAVDDLGVMGRYTSLALDGTGNPHIAYYGTPNLKYAHYDGTTWTVETVDSSNLVGRFASMALDGLDNPSISYYDEANQDLKFARWDGSSWQTETVDPGAVGDTNGSPTSLAFGVSGQPYILYFAADEVVLAHFDGADWQFETLPDPGAGVSALSLAFAENEEPTAAVMRQPLLDVLVFDGEEWERRLVDCAGATGLESSIFVDDADGVHFSYRSSEYLKYLAFDGQGWQMALVDGGGRSSSLALDSFGYPHISYETEDTLKYAYYDGQGWQVETVDYVGPTHSEDTVMRTSLGLGPDNLPHISYCHGCETLRYAHFSGSTWITTTLSSGGAGNSLAVDSAGLPHIAFWDSYNLKYAFFDGGAWTISTVDPNLYGEIALTLSETGMPRIVYDRQEGQVNYAVYDGAAWHLETAFSGYRTESLHSLALDSQGYPHFSQCVWNYHSWIALEYVHKDTAGWQVDILREGLADVHESDLDLDSLDMAHISYEYWGLVHHYQAPIALENVTIHGQELVGPGIDATYTASFEPEDAYEPVTITWSNGMTGTTAVYNWDQIGTYTVTVSASNIVSVVTDTLAVAVSNLQYLPIVYGIPNTGDLYGGVYNEVTHVGIHGATICDYTVGRCTTTDVNGLYHLNDIPVGEHSVRTTSGGYYDQWLDVTINFHTATEANFYLTPKTGSASGRVISAVTANGIGGASVCLSSGSPCTTADGSGYYTLTNLMPGSRTLRASAGGYISLDQEVNIVAEQTSPLDFVLSPTLAEGEMRIVLTWGADPRDLDSHLWLPSNHPYHVYFNHPGNCSGDPWACLDVDDQYSYGPETITIKQSFSGTYTFAIHKFTGTGSITGSGAQVKVYGASGLVASFSVPTVGTGDWWHVFNINGSTGELTIYNTIQVSSPGPY